MEPLRRTALFARHQELGARMVPFAGWEMPVQYSGILDEHHAVRNAAGLFDISHMGQVFVQGRDSLPYLQSLVTQDVATIRPGQSNYSLLCHHHGGIVDDIFIYNLGERYLVVVNASNTDKDYAWMREQLGEFEVTVENQSDATSMLALQGPQAETIAAQLSNSDIAGIPFHGVLDQISIAGVPAIIARTGYTGEDGFELFVANHDARQLWDALLQAGAPLGLKPCGLGARDSLRFEPCLALYGHEIADDINPYEARLGWVVKLEKGPFVGSASLTAIKAAGSQRRLVGLEMIERGIARGGYLVHSLEGQKVGYVTTGMPSPTLGKNLALAYVPTTLSEAGTELDVIVRDKPVRARVVKTPFYKARYKK